MDTAAEALLIIVSATLTVFLILLSIAVYYLIKLFRRADQVADSVESAAEAVKKSAKAMPIVSFLSDIITGKRRKGKKNGKR